MSIVKMNMSSYVIEEISDAETAYGGGYKQIGYNYSQLQLATQEYDKTIEKKQPTLPPSLVAADIGIFLMGISTN